MLLPAKAAPQDGDATLKKRNVRNAVEFGGLLTRPEWQGTEGRMCQPLRSAVGHARGAPRSHWIFLTKRWDWPPAIARHH